MRQPTSATRRPARRREAGITLLELMVVVVIVGILASIAYPSYQTFTLRARRADAQQMLMDIAARQERYFGDEREYADDFGDLGYPAARIVSGSLQSDDDYYLIELDRASPGSYTLTATPTGNHSDTECGELTLASNGERGSAQGTLERCW